jgi:hypothetical protein
MVASELETGTNQFARTQSITMRRWLAVRAGWLLLAAALAGAVSAVVTGIFVVLAAALLGVTFWVLRRRDA